MRLVQDLERPSGVRGDQPLGNDELKALPTANPLEQQYYTLFLTSPPALTGRCNVCVTITYTATWLELLNLNKS